MTPAVRAAQAAQVEFTLHRYAHDPEADSTEPTANGRPLTLLRAAGKLARTTGCT
jgi:hypothetical protein